MTIGADVVIGPNCTIGAPGFGYDKLDDGSWQYRTHTAGVVIERDVRIGSGSYVDQGRTRATTVGKGSRIDNGCHIAHGVQIGRNCMVVALAEISGSVELGDGSWIGPSACVRQGLKIGARALVGMGAVVIRDVAENVTVGGNPARVLNADIGVRESM